MVRRTAFATQIGKQPASLHYHTDIFLPFQPLHFHYCPPVSAHLPVVLLFSSALTCHLCFTLSPSGCLSWETSVFWRDWNRHSNIRLSHIYIHTNTMTQTLYTQLIYILYCGIDVIMLRFYMHVSHTHTHTFLYSTLLNFSRIWTQILYKGTSVTFFSSDKVVSLYLSFLFMSLCHTYMHKYTHALT